MADKKKQTLVYKPYYKGKIIDQNTFKRALRFFAMTLAICLFHLLVATALSFNAALLRILLNAALILGILSVYYFTGTRDGFDDVNAGEIVYQHINNGMDEPQRAKDRCFCKLKGLTTGFFGCLIPFLIALVYAVVAKKAEYSLQALPNWVAPYLSEEGIGSALQYYTVTSAFTAVDLIRIIVRIMILPYVNIVGTSNADNLFLLDKLCPLIMLLPMVSYFLGYLQGPKQRAMIHGSIARSNKRRKRKARTIVPKRHNEPKQLV